MTRWLLVLGWALLPFAPVMGGLPVLSLAAWSGWREQDQAAVLAAVVGLVTSGVGAVALGTWPLPVLVGLAVAAVLRRRLGWQTAPWWSRGRTDAAVIAAGAGFAVVAAAALVTWLQLVEPDLSDLFGRVQGYPWPLLVAGGLLFSMANALAEEAAWRGHLQDALGRGWPAAAAVSASALCFGLAHIQGFPRGWVGVGLASIYGLMLGWLRHRAGGLLAVFVVHVTTDCVIVGLLAWAAAD